MIYLGPGGIPTITEGDTIQGIKDVKKLGLNAMEIEFVRGVYLKKDKAIEVGKVAKKLGIKLSIHASYYINLCNSSKIKVSQKRILESCEIGNYLGAKYVVFHPGYYGNLDPEKAYLLIKKSCEELRKIIDRNDWNVVLGLETTGKKSQFGTLEENLRISEEVKGCVPIIDFAHIFARNGGKINFSNVLEKVKKFKEIHTHFSGIEFTEKGERYHLTISSKKPNFEELAKELAKRKFNKKRDIIIISESPILEKDSLKMKRILNKFIN
jgi:deoxyribonuclease-4